MNPRKITILLIWFLFLPIFVNLSAETMERDMLFGDLIAAVSKEDNKEAGRHQMSMIALLSEAALLCDCPNVCGCRIFWAPTRGAPTNSIIP